MQIIKNYLGISMSKGLPAALLEHLKEFFIQLHESLGHGVNLDEFSLQEHGYFVILETGDDVRDLRQVGLNAESQGLLGTWPEWVEKRELSDGSWVYQIAVLYDNDYMMFFYAYPETLDQDVENWFEEQVLWQAGSLGR